MVSVSFPSHSNVDQLPFLSVVQWLKKDVPYEEGSKVKDIGKAKFNYKSQDLNGIYRDSGLEKKSVSWTSEKLSSFILSFSTSCEPSL